MRPIVLALCLSAASAAGAAPLPSSTAPDGRPGVLPVQDRLIPRFFGGDDSDRDRERAAMALRIEQLEEQVRMLTGQVERLTFTVRRLEEAIAATRLGDGASLPEERAAAPAPQAPEPARVPAETGPLDLSALNRGPGEAVAVAPSGVRRSEPVTTPELRQVRALYDSGRYAMAAQEARKVLTDNPAGPVAGEARFLLGEALLAQGSYRNAANLFLENYTTDPAGARAPASLLKLSSALVGLGELEAACSSLEELLGAYPDVDPEIRSAAERERQTARCS